MRKISMDTQLYAFLHAWWAFLNVPEVRSLDREEEPSAHLAVSPPGRQPTSETFIAAAWHIPVDYYFMEGNMDFEENVTIRSVQLMQNYRRAEDKFAPTGIFTQARLMRQTAVGDDSAEGVEKLLSKVTLAVSPDYDVTKKKKIRRGRFAVL